MADTALAQAIDPPLPQGDGERVAAGRALEVSTKTCDLDATHTGPLFTLTVLAVLLGPGTRRKDQKRRVARKVLGCFCLDCAKSLEFRVGTAELRALGHELEMFGGSHDI
jgi:hypothetical protein